MFAKTFIFISVVLSAVISASAQAAYTPAQGSAERKAILDALRTPVERDLKQPIVFVPSHFRIQGNWAFVSGEPQARSGGRPVLKGTAWEGSEDLFDDNFFGLLRRSGSKWRVVTHALGCTDVCYADWWKRYKAPKAIFPYTE